MRRVHLWNLERGARTHSPYLRRAAAAIAAYACPEEGRGLGDDLFEEITKGQARQADANIGALFINWYLYHIGAFVDYIDGGRGVAPNGNQLEVFTYRAQYTDAWRIPFDTDTGIWTRPDTGDIVLLGKWPDCRLVVFEEIGQNNVASFWEYGFISKMLQGIKVKSIWRSAVTKHWIEDAPVLGWLNISMVPLQFPATVPDNFSEGVDAT